MQNSGILLSSDCDRLTVAGQGTMERHKFNPKGGNRPD